MSFAMTPLQVELQVKTVTRRFGWWSLKPGDLVQPVRKAMGLKEGEQVEKIGPPIRIVSVRQERLDAITPKEVVHEGFAGWLPTQFVRMLCEQYKCEPDAVCNRIEFEYVEAGDTP